jgi:hypothetical protein
VRIHHGALVWFYVGVVCGAIALANILSRNLSSTAIKWILVLGVLHWLIGGILCFAWDAVRIEVASRDARKNVQPRKTPSMAEWHYASEFLLPGNRKSLLPPRY